MINVELVERVARRVLDGWSVTVKEEPAAEGGSLVSLTVSRQGRQSIYAYDITFPGQELVCGINNFLAHKLVAYVISLEIDKAFADETETDLKNVYERKEN